MHKKKLSKKQQIIEYLKCKNDPIYFICNYIELELPGGNQLMDMYEVQKKFLVSILKDHHVIALKSRQTGISTVTQAFIVYTFTFYDNVVVGVVSKDGDEATDFSRKVQAMIKALPEWLKPKFEKQTEQTFILDNGCKFYAQTINPKNPGKLFRGKSITIAVMDEAAHADYIDKAWVGFGPALVKNQKVAKENNVPYATIVISTPNGTTGTGKWYYDSWKEALSGNSIYKPHIIHWSMVPDFANDPSWYEQQCKILKNNQRLINQELELKFLGSDFSFFEPDIIDKLNTVHQNPIDKIDFGDKNILKIWKKPEKGKFYLIGIDTASSHGGDKSTIEVCEFDTLEQVAEFKGKLRIDDFIKIIKFVLKMYKNHLAIPENNSYGETIVEALTDKHDPNILDYNIYAPNHEYGKQNIIYGLNNNAKTRPLIIESLYEIVKEDPSIIKSMELALELIGLESKKSGKIEACMGMNDDLALAFAFCCYVRQYDPQAKSKVISTKSVTSNVESIIDDNDVTLPFSKFSTKYLEKYKNNDQEYLMQKNKLLKEYIKQTLNKGHSLDFNDIFNPSVPDETDDGDLILDAFNIYGD